MRVLLVRIRGLLLLEWMLRMMVLVRMLVLV